MASNIEWRSIANYEDRYYVNRDGEILSKCRKTPHLRKKKLSRKGYYTVTLSKDDKAKTHYVHRLVAESFIPNPKNLPEINHINEDKLDNQVENLEWCDRSYNVNYGKRIAKQRANLCKRVIQQTAEGEIIAIFDSTVSASKATGCNSSSIAECCRNVKRKTVGGFVWRYADE